MPDPCSSIGSQACGDERTREETEEQEGFCPILSPPENHVPRCYRAYVAEGEQEREEKSGDIQPQAPAPREPGDREPESYTGGGVESGDDSKASEHLPCESSS